MTILVKTPFRMAEKKLSNKKRVAISYEKLTPELRLLLSQHYPDGYMDHMMRISKPNGDIFYGVVLETEDINYLVKVSVKIDELSGEEEEEEKEDMYGDDDDIKGADDIPDGDDDE